MSEWQPIETAPKDGTRVLLFKPTEWPLLVESVIDAYYRQTEGGGEWVATPTGYCISFATHWQPMLESPEESDERIPRLG